MKKLDIFEQENMNRRSKVV